MTISPRIWEFPAMPIRNQIFHVPGAAYDGGMTSGGAQLITPEPGGFAVLEIEPDINDGEWLNPASSWIMSKTNGEVFRVRLANSPQICWSRTRFNRLDWNWLNEEPGSEVDATAYFSSPALKATSVVRINLAAFGKVLRPGHVFGHAGETYIADEVSYSGDVAEVSVKPPLRRNIAAGDACPLRPWFTCRIASPDFRGAYGMLGHVKLGKITLNEAIVP